MIVSKRAWGLGRLRVFFVKKIKIGIDKNS